LISAPAETLSALAALALYRTRVLPAARHELRGWDARAARMPAGPLRDAATGALRDKRSNPEATAVFAILAPLPRRVAALRAMIALQVAIDYLDSLGEQAVADPLGDGLALHGALSDAVSPEPPKGEWYRLHPEAEDGGYLEALVATCREALGTLPSRQAVSMPLRRAAERCGEGQARTHASAAGGSDARQLRSWALQLPATFGYSWWELAAGASSSVAAHALIAAAADPAKTTAQAELIEAAYFPSIGALTVLLDDLVDREADLESGEHNYLSYYGDAEEAGERLGRIAARARAAILQLPHQRRHGAILAGVSGFYLSTVDHRDEDARPIRDRLLEAAGPGVRPIMALGRLRGHG
jgi:tetraprenyl-beta-curcumene synthase